MAVTDGRSDAASAPAQHAVVAAVISGFTADGIETMLENDITPEAWGTDQASLTNTNGVFVGRHSLAGHKQVRELRVALVLIAAPRTYVRREPPPRSPLPQRPRR